MKVKVINKSRHALPQYQTVGAAGFDITASLEAPLTIEPLERGAVPTGLYFVIPQGYEGQVRPRSGLAAKHGVTLLNSPGTIDSDYRGELRMLLVNLSNEAYTIHDGDRVGQMIIAPVEQAELVEIEAHEDETARGEGGFGHTGR